MDLAVGDDDSFVFVEGMPAGEVEVFSVDVGDPPTCLGDHQGAAGVIPDFLSIRGALGEPKIGVPFSS